MRMHPVGKLSPTGVLDMGRKCPHSCIFCVYSYYDNSNKQFNYLRKAHFLPKEELKSILDHFVEWGLSHFDYTGGEPSLHPDVVEVTKYAHHELGLQGRMITFGHFLQKKLRGSESTLLDELLEAGLGDFLFSFHTVDDNLFKQLTGADLSTLKKTMHVLDDRDFSYCTNIVVNNHNYATMPDTARYLAKHNVRIVNFIIMRMDWGLRNVPDVAVGTKGKYSDIVGSVTEAADILEEAGMAVNIRYAPYCVFKGYEKHIVGYKGIQLDAYEWRNGTLAASEGEAWLKNPDEAHYYRERVPLFENDPVYNLTFSEKCESCALRSICDGVDATYVKKHGWSEFQPYQGEQITDIVHFRHDYPGPFMLKESQYE